jgi:hypothetical protein
MLFPSMALTHSLTKVGGPKKGGEAVAPQGRHPISSAPSATSSSRCFFTAVSEERIRCWLGWVALPLEPHASPVQEALYSFMQF